MFARLRFLAVPFPNLVRRGILALLVLLALVASPALRAGYLERADARELVDELVEQGLERERLKTLLGDAERKDSILEAIARPAEKTLTWGEYRKIFVQPDRIRQGEAFWNEHRELILRAEKEFNVSRYILLAILGVETRYGKHKGSYRVLDALATLGFDYPPRAKFFRKQLRHFLLMEQEAGIDAGSLKGSYAGAMGYPQFIPSSYRAYAVDFDGDGKTDLVHSAADAIGSVANYFAEHGWRDGLPVAARARVNGNDYEDLFSRKMKPSTTLGALRERGITPLSCEDTQLPGPHCFSLPADTEIAPLHLEGEHGSEFWLGTRNFYVITRYNHSPLYAMAVYQLAVALEKHIGNDGE
jgi:membrane-bound lytic murein transglycosylase B